MPYQDSGVGRLPIQKLLSCAASLYIHGVPDFRGKRQSLFPVSFLFKHLPVRSAYGVNMIMDAFDKTNWYGVSGRYGYVVADEILKLRPGDCFIDVGANCGVFTLVASKQVGPKGLVIAFEPNLDSFAKLIANVRLNRLQNVMAFNLAISDRTGIIHLNDADGRHSGLCAVSTSPKTHREGVGSIQVDDFAALKIFIGHRRMLVKIDVEGHELRALVGLQSLLRMPNMFGIVVEIDQLNLGRFSDSASGIYTYLEEHGFHASTRRSDAHFDEVFQRTCVKIPEAHDIL